jgi:two-component system NarL family sensor kinase
MFITLFHNGVGFHPESELNKKEGLGLQNILRRAALVGGKAEIFSKPGEGTTLQIMMNYV